ncbi:hypothetical protein FRC12_003764 [Ceratobasidium sp. 428]|nr:hypothetical protein FRC12_003764 [Ceratobasidium sp. 428]
MSTPNITSQTTIQEIISLLSQHGCPNITDGLDLPNCTQWRVNGGGQGDIHEGALINGVRVAIKISRGDQSIDASKGNKSLKTRTYYTEQRVARELYTWFTLSHPNIAELLGMAVFQGRIAMISPWIAPGNFYKFISEFPEADRMDLCLQVADGLAYLHENQVIFGDLKAQNVLVGSDGIAKLTDFGLSILQKSHIVFSATSATGGGSARWMVCYELLEPARDLADFEHLQAPELIESSTERSFEADVYALAMTFVEILTDELPFPHISDDMKVMFAVLYKNDAPVRPKRLEVESLRHREWWRLLTQCWGRQPEMRPKATDWSLLDRAVTVERIRLLYEQLPHALCYGHTNSGPLKNLDTDEYLPPSDVTMTFFTSRIVGGPSSEASKRELVKLHASAIDTRQFSLEVAYVNTLQDLIYKSLEKRVHQVHHWITVNVAHVSPKHQIVHDLFTELDNITLEMIAAARICSCLLAFGHVNGEHVCGDEQNPGYMQQVWKDIQQTWKEEVWSIQQDCHIVSGGTRRRRCKYCQKVFRGPNALADHIKTHTGLRFHMCPYTSCDTGSAAKSTLKRHFETHGVGKLEDYPRNGRLSSNS